MRVKRFQAAMFCSGHCYAHDSAMLNYDSRLDGYARVLALTVLY